MASIDSGTDTKALVLQATDIVSLIGQTVALKKRGRDFVGLCPFHSEKTPSFAVNPAKQFFHCFGCKASGNAIDFVMKRDRIEFLDALRLMAEQAGIEMPKFGATKENASQRQVLLEAQQAAGVFFDKLLSHKTLGEAGRAYLLSRGFSDEIVKRFQIGLAADDWDALLKSPSMKKFPPAVLATAGLAKAKVDETTGEVLRYYDTFRNRLMFPIRDENGRLIAFGGRVMPGSTDPAKYLNSPETPLFSKSRCIYGLDQAKKKILETNPRTVAVVEGYTDVVMAHQYGATNVVSVLGTAMTEQHVSMLRRFADRIVLLFDPDTAGDLAVNRAVELFLTQPVEIAIAKLPDGLDPDEFLLKEGLTAFERVLDNAQDALTYKWKQLTREYASVAGDLTGQQKAVQQYLEMLADARGAGPVDVLRWGSALARVSRLTDIPIDELNRRFKTKRAGASKPVQTTQADPVGTRTGQKNVHLTAHDRAERQILGILLVESGKWHSVQEHVQVDDFTDATRKALADTIWMQLREEGEVAFSLFLASLPGEEIRELAVELADETEAMPETETMTTLEGAIAFLIDARRRREQQQSLSQARATVGTVDDESLRQLQEKARRPDLRRSGR